MSQLEGRCSPSCAKSSDNNAMIADLEPVSRLGRPHENRSSLVQRAQRQMRSVRRSVMAEVDCSQGWSDILQPRKSKTMPTKPKLAPLVTHSSRYCTSPSLSPPTGDKSRHFRRHRFGTK
mmetsp:Transcript_79471/g.146156  ORF Transcript_79471/g.146156 Transcript_79471/m.146156 type:complete len:120 (-) Transcript_79471:79-438(-)